nr:Protein C05C10.2, isoform b [Haemonchus contortus]
MHPDEGMLPLEVFRITEEERAFFEDRLGPFNNYVNDPNSSKAKVAKICSAACSALVAVNNADDDRRSHLTDATNVWPRWFPTRIRFHVHDMPSEAGWGPGRHAVVWVVGSNNLIQVKVVHVEPDSPARRLDVTAEAFRWSNLALQRAFTAHGTDIGIGHTAGICVRLVKTSASSDPVYELVSLSSMFENLQTDSIGHQVINLAFGCPRPNADQPLQLRDPPNLPQVDWTFSVQQQMIVLTQDQKEAVRLGCSNEPIVGIQAAFGTGKTLIGSLIAALSSDTPNTTVIVTTCTNAAVDQFTDTPDFSHLRVVRHISDSAAADNRTPTDADLGKILKTLGDTFYDQLDFDERVVCADFRDHRQLLEDYLAHHKRVPEMSDGEREQFEIAEEYVSTTLRRMIRIIFKVYRPSVICMTTASLLNSTASRTGIFTLYIPSFRTIIGDEGSQIPEPALLAIAARFQVARHIYIGDEHQLAPHAKCPHASNPVLHGARGVMTTLSHAPGVPVAPLVTTFRAHPTLIEIPNTIAYSGTLVSGTLAEARTLLLNSRIRFPSPGVPFTFIHMEDTSVQAISKSHYNTVEGTV